MNHEKTVIVLGAGASEPYGFPLGEGLRELLKHQVMPHYNKLVACGLKPDDIREFNHVLTFGTFGTIDELLETKAKYRDVGAFAIALTLFPLENFHKLFPASNWYLKLFKLLNLKSGEDASWLTLVTFNYDRSLEHFLRHSIEIQYSPDVIDAAKRKLDSIKIIHPHGSLGEYPKVLYGLQDASGVEQMPESRLKDAAERIRLVHEDLKHTPVFQEVQEAIGRARRIFFIGFGYERRTLERLFCQSDYAKEIVGTRYKLPDVDYLRVKHFFRQSPTTLVPQLADEFIDYIGLDVKPHALSRPP